MSDQVPSTSVQSEKSCEMKKKFVNAITQHGNESNADEENIVIFSPSHSHSPIRECDDPVQHEAFEYNDSADSTYVSTKIFLFRYFCSL